MNQAGHHAAAPGGFIHLAFLQHQPAFHTGNQVADVVDGFGLALFLFDPDDFLNRGVLHDSLGVAQVTHDQLGLKFIGFDDGLFDVVVNRGILGRQEARAHVHTLGTQCHSRNQAAAVGHATGSDKGNSQFLGSPGQQDEVGNVVFTRVAATLEAINTDGITTDTLGLEGMAHRGALVDNLDACRFELGHVLFRATAGGFHRLDATGDDGVNVLRIRRGIERRQESQVNAKGLVGHFVAAGDFPGQILRRRLGQAGDDSQTAGIGHGRGQFGIAHVMHTALDNRVAHAEHFSDSGLHSGFPFLCLEWLQITT